MSQGRKEDNKGSVVVQVPTMGHWSLILLQNPGGQCEAWVSDCHPRSEGTEVVIYTPAASVGRRLLNIRTTTGLQLAREKPAGKAIRMLAVRNQTISIT